MAAEKVVIETEELISNVQGTTCLWDHNDPNYFKRDYQRVGWMEVADAMKAPVHEVKKRWRGLRDTFARELRRLAMTESPLPLAQRCSWQHFSRLLFLRDAVSVCSKATGRPSVKRARRTSADRHATAPKHQYCDADALDDDEANLTDGDASRSSPESELPMLSVQPVLSYQLEQPESLARAHSPPPYAGQAMDSDAQFLLSLLPFLQDVPKRRKLVVRARLSRVLMDEQLPLQN